MNLAEDSLETSSLVFSEKQWKNIKYVWMSSAAVVIGALRVGALTAAYQSSNSQELTNHSLYDQLYQKSIETFAKLLVL